MRRAGVPIRRNILPGVLQWIRGRKWACARLEIGWFSEKVRRPDYRGDRSVWSDGRGIYPLSTFAIAYPQHCVFLFPLSHPGQLPWKKDERPVLYSLNTILKLLKPVEKIRWVGNQSFSRLKSGRLSACRGAGQEHIQARIINCWAPDHLLWSDFPRQGSERVQTASEPGPRQRIISCSPEKIWAELNIRRPTLALPFDLTVRPPCPGTCLPWPC